jgi:hypothetical protein
MESSKTGYIRRLPQKPGFGGSCFEFRKSRLLPLFPKPSLKPAGFWDRFNTPIIMKPLKKSLFFRVFFVFFISAVLEAGENRDLKLADFHYDDDDYVQAYGLYQQCILRQKAENLSGDVLYRYGYCYEQTRGLDNIALKIYALSKYYNKKREWSNTKYALYANAKLKDDPAWELDDGAAASILGELRDIINKERRAYFYGWVDRIYPFLSRFSIFQWKIIISLTALVPFFIGVLILGIRGRQKHS